MNTPTRIALTTVAAFALLLETGTARADDKQACSDAYAQTQTLQKDGKLQAARQQALLCVNETCAEFVRTDCTKWLAEIEASQPTVVIEVRDAAGSDVLDAKIELDGQPWLPTVDTKAHPIDPGSHTLRATTSKGVAEKTLVVREGDKNVRATLALTAQSPSQAAPPPPPSSTEPPSAESSGGGSLAPWIIGGTGLATMTVGAILGVVVVGKESTYEEHCPNEVCDAEAIAARDSGEGLAPVSTTLILVGAAAVGVGLVWILTEETGPSSEARVEVRTGPTVGAEGAGWRVGGSF